MNTRETPPQSQPREYFEKVGIAMETAHENQRFMKSFCEMLQALKEVGDLDTKLAQVLADIEKKFTSASESEQRKQAIDALVAVRTFVEALEDPARAKEIITNIDSEIMGEDAREAVLGPVDEEYRRGEKHLIHARKLVKAFVKYLDEYIASADKERNG
ncbi:hypothetical protein HYW17_00735 [Candidatus Uhrbacteria bacterium]|nr:hypothetical protein [Candidatus Uhrbacteria bacterium]